jgi:hypothetical protein
MFGNTKKLEEKVSSTLYDLTHLEINTIIKDEMNATKAPASPRLILHNLAGKYDLKLISLGDKYAEYIENPGRKGDNLFRGERVKEGSGYVAFQELSERAKSSVDLLNANKNRLPVPADYIEADIMMLKRIQTISNDIRRILKMDGVDPCEIDLKKSGKSGSVLKKSNKYFDFDDPETVITFRTMKSSEAEKYELNLDLRQLLVIKKANDIGTERVVLQTIIGLDGDVTTRISKAFADQPISFINEMHHEAIGISVEFWKSLITVVVELGKSIIGMFNPKA